MGGLFGGKADIQNPVDAAQVAAANANAQTGLNQQQAFMQALQAQGGLQNQSDMYNQFGQVAAGQGANPAMAQLANATGANVANQAAMAAGQRGAAGNVGMMARGAAQQGANIQQQAAGQGAALQAQQSLSAMGQQAQIAGNQVGNQAQATQGYMQGALGQQGTMINGMNTGNANTIKNQELENAAKNKMLDSAMKGGSAAATGGTSMFATAAIPKQAAGGEVKAAAPQKPSLMQSLMMAQGGTVPVLVSPGEAYVPPQNVKKVAQGGAVKQHGRMIPGTAKVQGDSEQNDTVPATLEPGGVVVPRTVMNAKDHDAAASKFVQAVLGKGNLRKRKK